MRALKSPIQSVGTCRPTSKLRPRQIAEISDPSSPRVRFRLVGRVSLTDQLNLEALQLWLNRIFFDHAPNMGILDETAQNKASCLFLIETKPKSKL